MFVLKTEPKQG